MKKWIALGLALVCLLTLAACAGQEPTEPVTKDLQAVYAGMKEKLPEMLELGPQDMLDYYGILEEDCQQVMGYVSMDGLRVDEVWLIQAKDEAALERLKTLAENRLSAKDEEAKNYFPEQYSVVQNGQVLTDGLYLALLVSPDAEAFSQLFQQG